MTQTGPIKALPWNVSNWNLRKSGRPCVVVKLFDGSLGSCQQPRSRPCEGSQSAQEAVTPTWRDKDKEQGSSPGCTLSLGVQASLRSSWLPHRQLKLGFHYLQPEVLTSACFYLSLKIFFQVCVKSRKQTVLKLPLECFTYVPQRRPARLGESLCSHSLFSRIIQMIKWRRGVNSRL